jgi:hypothetical protein
MSSGFQLGINQFPVHADLEPASIRRDEGQAFDFRFELLKQLSRQTDGAIGVVSYSTIYKLNFHQHPYLLIGI